MIRPLNDEIVLGGKFPLTGHGLCRSTFLPAAKTPAGTDRKSPVVDRMAGRGIEAAEPFAREG
ncbi:hypothetical protein L0F81_37500 [Streptomyces tricolor]|uniref:Uncharacterized protein n=1 Tax=Streptomyces tricolor TaxID=68277 RepID=A0ABS9JTN6_9ACTN|nr:hypothetical protein [Streptomyces tricolor]MCG0068900.1 hypothetical protein [Streptomyces tricolor]